ncbi:MAG: NAD(P)/FAD-dependent oxidoreductase [Henriciella sp.]
MNERIAIVGCGPAGIVSAICLARRGIATTVIDADTNPLLGATYDPNRSYAIDITGHGLNAIRHIDAVAAFDEHMLPFSGINAHGALVDAWSEDGWIGSRGDIMRVFMHEIQNRYAELVTFHFNTKVSAIDFDNGVLSCAPIETDGLGSSRDETYDLIIAADGGGSVVRKLAEQIVPGFTVERKAQPYFTRIIALDNAKVSLDPTRLHVLSLPYMSVTGAINGPGGPSDPIWFCQIPFATDKPFESLESTRKFLTKHMPQIADLVTEDEVISFSERPAYNIGRVTKNSQAYAGKVIFVGDACTAFPPVGQGANAAMEAAMYLDLSIEACTENGRSIIENLDAISRHFDQEWLAQANSMSWLATKLIMTKISHVIRARLTNAIGLNVIADTKRSDFSYLDTYKKAKRMGPIWAF